MLTVLGSLPEFERDLIRARTSEGRKLTQYLRREAIRRRDRALMAMPGAAATYMGTECCTMVGSRLSGRMP